MSPEEFDQVYVAIARALGEAADPELFRDRLILLLAQRLPVEEVLDAVAAARLTVPVEALKTAADPTDVSELPHT
jgi:hypothetical protein